MRFRRKRQHPDPATIMAIVDTFEEVKERDNVNYRFAHVHPKLFRKLVSDPTSEAVNLGGFNPVSESDFWVLPDPDMKGDFYDVEFCEDSPLVPEPLRRELGMGAYDA